MASTSNVTWPHTWVVPKYATMAEYKQYAPANHFHAIWGLTPARLQYWMDLANVLVGGALVAAAARGSRAWTARCRCCTCSTAAKSSAKLLRAGRG